VLHTHTALLAKGYACVWQFSSKDDAERDWMSCPKVLWVFATDQAQPMPTEDDLQDLHGLTALYVFF